MANIKSIQGFLVMSRRMDITTVLASLIILFVLVLIFKTDGFPQIICGIAMILALSGLLIRHLSAYRFNVLYSNLTIEEIPLEKVKKFRYLIYFAFIIQIIALVFIIWGLAAMVISRQQP